MFGSRDHAGAMVTHIVRIRPIDQYVERKPFGNLLDLRVQLRLAEVAPVPRVGDVTGLGELVSVDHLVPNADPPGDQPGILQLAARQTRTHRSDGKGPVSTSELGRLRHDCTVDPARERDGHPPALSQGGQQSISFLGQGAGQGNSTCMEELNLVPAQDNNSEPTAVFPGLAGGVDSSVRRGVIARISTFGLATTSRRWAPFVHRQKTTE
jgi:hypothetical protein